MRAVTTQIPHGFEFELWSSAYSLHTASLSHSPSLSGGTTVNIEDFHSSFNQCRVRTASSNVTGGWWLGNCLAGCVQSPRIPFVFTPFRLPHQLICGHWEGQVLSSGICSHRAWNWARRGVMTEVYFCVQFYSFFQSAWNLNYFHPN